MTKAGSNIPELETKESPAQGCWILGDGGTGTVPPLNLPLKDTGFFLAGSRWESTGSKRECNLRMEAADFRLPFSQPLLGVVWCDHQ